MDLAIYGAQGYALGAYEVRISVSVKKYSLFLFE